MGSLLGDAAASSLAPEAERQEIPLDRIRPNPFQPRKVFDGEGLEELRESIQRHGVLQPIVVRPAEGGFELVSGERRWRAAQQAGLARIPAVVRPQVSDDDLLELALVENLQRRDLDPIERARGFQLLLERLNLTQQEVAERVGLKRASVANHLRLLELPEPIQAALTKGLIQMGHAKALLGLPTPKAMMAVLGDIVRQDLSVRQVEDRVRERQAKAQAVPVQASPRSPWARELERRMEEHLGSKVQLQGQAESGRIVIEYGSRVELDRLADLLAPRPTL